MDSIETILSALRREMSQEAIAREIGASQSLISRWQSGRVADGAGKMVKLIELAKSRGIDLDRSKKEPA